MAKKQKGVSQRKKGRPQRRGGGGALAAIATVVVLAIGAGVVLAFTAFGGGDGDSSGSAEPTRRVDLRLGGLEPTSSVRVEARDQGQQVNTIFVPDQISGPAGEVLEIVVANTGTVAHNLRVSGLDKTYDTADDWETDVFSVKPGEEGRVWLKIDEPGVYPFRCDFHPTTQIGTLVLN